MYFLHITILLLIFANKLAYSITKNTIMAQKITFSLSPEIVADATEGLLLGDFNNWLEEAGVKLKKQKDGSLKATLDLEPGIYQYRYFLNDGRWVNDANAVGYNFVGEFGVDNCVISVSAEEVKETIAKSEIAAAVAPKKVAAKKEVAPKAAAPKTEKVAAPKPAAKTATPKAAAPKAAAPKVATPKAAAPKVAAKSAAPKAAAKKAVAPAKKAAKKGK